MASKETVKALKTAIAEQTPIRQKRFNVAFINDVNPGGEFILQESGCPELGIDEEEGVIVDYVGKFQGIMGRFQGRNMPESEAYQLMDEEDDLDIPIFHVYDVFIADFAETDGPDERAELRASFEQSQKLKKQEREGSGDMAAALKELTSFLKAGSQVNMDPKAFVDAVMEGNLLNASQLEELALQKQEMEEAEAK